MADSKLSALTALTGANVDATADIISIVDTSVTTSKKITFDEAFLGMLASTTNARFKVGSLTRDISLASGNISTTGIGFKPKFILFTCGLSGGGNGSFDGFDDGTTASCLPYLAGSFFPATFASVFIYADANNYHYGKVNSFDTDGFTIAWTKVLAPTGTLTVMYQAFR